MKTVYVIGSLRNPDIPKIANLLETAGFEPFTEWWCASEDADDWWKEHEKQRGRTHAQALKGWAAKHIYHFDRFHLDRCDGGLLVMPAGRSGHIELGYLLGQKKPGYILFPNGEEDTRWDVMHLFATEIFFSIGEMMAFFAGGNDE